MLGMLEMLGSFDRCNLKIRKLGMLGMFRMHEGNLLGMNVGNVRNEFYEC